MKGSFDLALAIAILILGTVIFFFSFFSLNDDAEEVQQFFDDPVGEVITNDVTQAVGDVNLAQTCRWNSLLDQVEGLTRTLAQIFDESVESYLLTRAPDGSWEAVRFFVAGGSVSNELITDNDLRQMLIQEAENQGCDHCYIAHAVRNILTGQCCGRDHSDGGDQGGGGCTTNTDCTGDRVACINGQCMPCSEGNVPAGIIQSMYDFDSSFFANLNRGFIRLTSNWGEPIDVGCVPCPEGFDGFNFCGCPANTAPDGNGGCTRCRPGFGGSYGNCDSAGAGSTGSQGGGGTEGGNGFDGTGSNGSGATGGPGSSNGLFNPENP